ncbi:MAG: hypothetical protein ACI9R3_005748 [Verrucomicrobiales bacterium]|jgi:hypothetical protein
MATQDSTSRFTTKLRRPAKPGAGSSWTFLVIPKAVSDTLPRRGRATVEGTINGHRFQATLDPDGQLGHWLKVSEKLRKAAGVEIGDRVTLEIASVAKEPEPEIPSDFKAALAGAPEAHKVWEDTTTIARLDWIHWIVSARQAKTRTKRIGDACEMLAEGKRRVCCFDQSGYYSKAFRLPEAAG